MDLSKCSKCGADLIENGIYEVTVGGVSETFVKFGINEEQQKEAEFGSTDISNFDDTWVVCGACNAEMHDRKVAEIIDAYEQGLPHIVERYECQECSETFEKIDCNICEKKQEGQCTGQHDNTLCKECCAQSFGEMYIRSPIAALMQEAL